MKPLPETFSSPLALIFVLFNVTQHALIDFVFRQTLLAHRAT
jgi:hypothetical protein